MMRSSERPSASLSVKPNTRSAAGFHSTIDPSAPAAMIASPAACTNCSGSKCRLAMRRGLREDAELEIGRRDFPHGAEEGRGAEIAGPRELPQLVDLAIRGDHRLLEPRVDQVDLVCAVHDLQPLLVRNRSSGRLFDRGQYALGRRFLEALADPAEAHVRQVLDPLEVRYGDA